jgi:hypothetical protein
LILDRPGPGALGYQPVAVQSVAVNVRSDQGYWFLTGGSRNGPGTSLGL